jgi:hypothetical protein
MWRRMWWRGRRRRPPRWPPGWPLARNATTLTEHKVHELLDRAVSTATLVVAVQEIGAAPAGHVPGCVGGAVQLLLVWGLQARGPQGRGIGFLVHTWGTKKPAG